MRSISLIAIILAIAAAVQSAPLDATKDLAADKPSTQMLCPWVPGCIKECNGNKDCIQFCIDNCPRRGRDRDFGAGAVAAAVRPQMLCPWVPGCIKRCEGKQECIRECIKSCPPKRDEPWM